MREFGKKYKTNLIKLPGKPDIVIKEDKKIIFINGCFWYQHKRCKRKTMPKTNIKYWKDKLSYNAKKQKKDIILLRKYGWKVNIIWECETKNEEGLIKKLGKILK